MVGTSDRQESYLLETGSGRFIRLSATAYSVLAGIDAGATPAEVAQDLSRRLGRAITAEHVEAAYAEVRQRVDVIEQQTGRAKPFGLWFRVRLLPAPVTAALSRRLSGLFHPAVGAPVAVVVTLAAISTLLSHSSGPESIVDPGASFLPLVGLFVLSMFAHELGHASASMRYEAPARDIGFGLYLIYPVFYNDVTAAWRLTRRQRVVVDLAGVLFQFLAGTTYLIISRLTGSDLFHLAATSVFFLGLFVMLPIFKFDGYWLLSDLLGVVNLSQQVRRVTTHVRGRLRDRPGAQLPWPPWVSAAVLAYGAISVAIIVMFVLRLVLVVPDLAAAYPARIAGLARDLYLPPHTPAAGRLSSVLGPTYILLGTALALLTLARRMIQVQRRNGTTRHRQ